jgi:hypothetical protein
MKPKWNWRLWAGFTVSVLALVIYVFGFETTRRIIWLSAALCLVALVLLISGLRRAFTQPDAHRGKVAGPVLTVLSVLVIAAFAFFSYQVPKGYASAHNTPRVGDRAPEFALSDSSGNAVALNQLLSTSENGRAPRGVLLVFYRGYW